MRLQNRQDRRIEAEPDLPVVAGEGGDGLEILALCGVDHGVVDDAFLVVAEGGVDSVLFGGGCVSRGVSGCDGGERVWRGGTY